MSRKNSITFGRYQLTEAFVFAGFLSVAVSAYLFVSQTNTNNLWSAVAQSPQCAWNNHAPATIPQNLGQNLYQNAQLAEVASDNESPLEWQINTWGDMESTFEYLRDFGHNDQTSVKVEVTSGKQGDAKWEQAMAIPAQPQTSYIYRNYYQSNIDTYTVVEYTLKDQTRQYVNLGVSPPSQDWNESSYTLITPRHTTHVSIFQVVSQPGYLITDDYRLSRYTSPPLPSGIVSLTFDDGAQTTHQNALPLLKKYDLTSSQYIVTDPLDAPYNHYHYNTEQLADFAEADHEIGSHSVSHRDLTELDQKLLSYELAVSKLDLYQQLGYNVPGFSTPYGHYNSETIEAIQQFYCYHRSTDIGFNSPDYFDVYNIKVQNIEVDTTVEQVQSWINYAEKNRVWLVLVFHEIDDKGGHYSYTPENLEKVLQHLKSRPVQVSTIEDSIPLMQATQAELGLISTK